MTSRGKMKENKPNAKKSIRARSGLGILAPRFLGEQTEEARPESSGMIEEKHQGVMQKVSFERFGENVERETIHSN